MNLKKKKNETKRNKNPFPFDAVRAFSSSRVIQKKKNERKEWKTVFALAKNNVVERSCVPAASHHLKQSKGTLHDPQKKAAKIRKRRLMNDVFYVIVCGVARLLQFFSEIEEMKKKRFNSSTTSQHLIG